MAKAPARSSCGDYSKFEVKKESNGKLRCLVCPSLPSLDTFEMFLVHKEGKKHQAALVDFRKKIQLAKKKKPLSHKPTRAHSKVTAKPTYLPYQSRVQNFVPPSCVPTVPQDVANQWKEYNEQMMHWRQLQAQYAQNGWILHEDGSWERDATVEFDSDDENANNAPTLEQ